MSEKSNDKPWISDRWFVSPWNYHEETVKEFSFPDNIKIHDVSLRDGEQQAGVEFTRQEKVKLAMKLAEAGVHRIEAGMPAVSKEDEAAIKEIVKLGSGAEIFGFARCMKEDIQKAADCGVTGVIVEIPASEHIIEHAYKWPLERAIDLSIEATSYAKELGLYTVFFPIDASRAEMGWYLDLVEKVATEGHMDALALVDTFGVLSPHAVSYFVKKSKERLNIPLETHFHSDFGMGAANTIVALAAGAEVVHCTVTGIGERAGNASMEEVVLTLLTMYGIDVGIKTEKFYGLSKLVRELSGLQIPSNRPIVGDMLFNVESGIIANWVKNAGQEHILEVFPFHWNLVGQVPVEVVLGKNSGLDSIRIWLDKIGVDANDEQMQVVLLKVKERSLQKKALVNVDEFRESVDRAVA